MKDKLKRLVSSYLRYKKRWIDIANGHFEFLTSFGKWRSQHLILYSHCDSKCE